VQNWPSPPKLPAKHDDDSCTVTFSPAEDWVPTVTVTLRVPTRRLPGTVQISRESPRWNTLPHRVSLPIITTWLN
jgi:hypothetical protein